MRARWGYAENVVTQGEGENTINRIRGGASVTVASCLDVTGHLVIFSGVRCISSPYVDSPSV